MKSHALLVGLGIFLSRVSGLIRERVFAHFFGNSDAGDAFKAALKIPNFLQNLFGEGVLSASFIPVYAELLAKKHQEEAARVASVIGSLLFLMTSFLVLVGVITAPWLIDLIAPGFAGEKKQLTTDIVQILFPGTGFLVMSAWCLGILNSHRRFFLSYVAPVIWNISIIAALVLWGSQQLQVELAITAAWGLVVGSFLQFVVQLPTAWRLAGKIRFSLDWNWTPVQAVLKNFAPGVVSRGVVQISAYIDNVIASLLPTGAVSALAYAQTLYLLPVSLFGMSVSAAELPAMSSATGTADDISRYLRERLNRGLQQIAFFIVPSMFAFIFLGDLIVGAVFQTGAFDRESTQFVWIVLAGYSVGLLSSTLGRLYSSSFYSLKDSRTPLKFAILRVLLSTALGAFGAFYAPSFLGLAPKWGTACLTLAAASASWLEYTLLRVSLKARIGATGLSFKFLCKTGFAAFLGALFGFVLASQTLLLERSILSRAFFSLLGFGFVYLGVCMILGLDQARDLVQKLVRRKKL